MAEKQNTPEIRFEGFTDPWEQRKFSDMYVVNNERNANCELGYDRTLSIATMTFNGGNGAADDSLSNYKVIRIGDIAFEGHTNKVHAYGRFVLNDAGDGLMSPRFSCLRPIVEQRYSFWKYYIPREESMRPILVNATKSGTMMNELVPDDLMRESILVPCLAEQEVIGNSLSQLDHLITLHQRKYDKLCTVKKSMLDKMFPKPGETEPEIRFEGFTDPWEQRKLGDLISVYIAHAGPEEDVTVLTSSRDGIQKQEDHFGRLQQHDTSDWNLIPYGYCTYRNRSDDGLFTFNVNKVADRGIVSKFYPVFETPECDADFLVAYLNSSQEIRKKLFVLAVGTSQVVLSYGALKELSLLLPQNREQSAIANVLNHIDNLITLHQRKLELLRNIKKSLLDRMFV